jgi:cold shock CspA family protein
MSTERLGILHKWYGQRGYGFLRTAVRDYQGKLVMINDRSVPDTFVHVSEIQRCGIHDFAEGDAFTFDVRQKAGRAPSIL